jgi:hypothetical protein
MLVDLVGDDRIAIIRLREKAAEFLLRIIMEDGKQELASIDNEERLIIGQKLREERDCEEGKENPKRPITALIGPEVSKTAPVNRTQLKPAPRRLQTGGTRDNPF